MNNDNQYLLSITQLTIYITIYTTIFFPIYEEEIIV